MAICDTKEIRVDDIGTKLELEVLEDSVAVDISTASTKDITLQRPDGTTIVHEGVFTTDGTEGKVYFTTSLGDLSMEGTYYIQVYIALATWQGYSTIGEFEVHDNLV